jgi:hypothetical protein
VRRFGFGFEGKKDLLGRRSVSATISDLHQSFAV